MRINKYDRSRMRHYSSRSPRRRMAGSDWTKPRYADLMNLKDTIFEAGKWRRIFLLKRRYKEERFVLADLWKLGLRPRTPNRKGIVNPYLVRR